VVSSCTRDDYSWLRAILIQLPGLATTGMNWDHLLPGRIAFGDGCFATPALLVSLLREKRSHEAAMR
jgi:hypothetical protein